MGVPVRLATRVPAARGLPRLLRFLISAESSASGGGKAGLSGGGSANGLDGEKKKISHQGKEGEGAFQRGVSLSPIGRTNAQEGRQDYICCK